MGNVNTKDNTSAKLNASLRANSTQEAEEKTKSGRGRSGKPPKKFIMPKDKVTHTLYETENEILYNQQYKLNVGSRKNAPVYVFMIITNDEAPSGETALKLTRGNQAIFFSEYDEQVMNAAISFWTAGNPQFTAAQIYRTMNGQAETETPSKQSIDEVTESLRKLKGVICEIDATDEAIFKKMKDSDGKPINMLKITGNLLSFDEIEYGKEGEKGKYNEFVLTCAPLLYRYSSMNRQFITVPNSVLCIRDVGDNGVLGAKIANSKNRIEIRGDLIKHIEMMKHDEKKAAESFRKAKPSKNQPVKPLESYRKTSRNINFENLFKSLNISTSREIRKRHIEYITACLKYWKAIEYIRDYSINKEKKTATIVI